jgi:hypothetical protein
MEIIFFVGHGVTPKAINYEYKNNQYIKNDFVKLLRKLCTVIIPDIPYHHLYYYEKTNIEGYKERYDPINNLNINDILIEKFISNLNIDNTKKYIVMGSSDGIYFAMEFAKQFPNLVKHIISLDGSWITIKLCEQRLTNWNNKGKVVNIIKTQNQLNNIIDKIKTEDNNNKYISEIMDYTRLNHTEYCIKNKYEDILEKINYTSFRDVIENATSNEDIQFNNYANEEDNILSVYKKYKIIRMPSAGHVLWFNKLYKEQIVDYISNILNNQSGGSIYYHKYQKYKSKYMKIKL